MSSSRHPSSTAGYRTASKWPRWYPFASQTSLITVNQERTDRSRSCPLGKALEAVVAERILYLTETHHLLPNDHFGARKRRSTTQALPILQERIWDAWRERKLLFLVGFDVKGASRLLACYWAKHLWCRKTPQLASG